MPEASGRAQVRPWALASDMQAGTGRAPAVGRASKPEGKDGRLTSRMRSGASLTALQDKGTGFGRRDRIQLVGESAKPAVSQRLGGE